MYLLLDSVQVGERDVQPLSGLITTGVNFGDFISVKSRSLDVVCVAPKLLHLIFKPTCVRSHFISGECLKVMHDTHNHIYFVSKV